MSDTPNLSLPYIASAQAQKHVTHNEAIRSLDALVQVAVVDRDLTAPPLSPAEGERYIVASGATGAWATHDAKLAAWQDGAWAFYSPREGWIVWVSDEGLLVCWNATAWTEVTGATASLLQNASFVGINATADTTNRLSVSAPATLLNHEGGGHQLKLNKNGATQTASLLYQTGFSGRAELGTTGDDDFHVKVSPDGANWNEAIVIDNATGSVSFPNTATLPSGGSSAGLAVAASRAELKATATTSSVVLLKEDGREGLYTWNPIVAIERHQSDTDERDLIAPNSAGMGAWERTEKFGATDVKAAFLSIINQRLGGKVVLRKVRDTGAINEFHVYTQLGRNSPEWARWVCSNHSNSPNASGALRMSGCSRALLYQRRTQRSPHYLTHIGNSNDDVNTGGKIWTATQGSETGTFTTSNLAGHEIRYATTTGDTVSYLVRGIELLAARGYATTNGGTAKITITQGGAEIPAASYIIPEDGGVHRLSFRQSGSNVGVVLVPLAKLDPSVEYVVTLEVDSTNPTGGRMYQAGLVGWPPQWKTTPGPFGILIRAGTETNGWHQRYAGERVVYACNNCTRIEWTGRARTDRGIVGFEVYDSNGNPVTLDVATHDMYAAISQVRTVRVADNLPEGDYFLHVIVTGAKNAAASAFLIDHRETTTINALRSGNPETDSFDTFDAPPLATSVATGTSDYIGYDTTQERTFVLWKTSETAISGNFVGGVHGNEDLVSVVYEVDDQVVDWNAASAGDQWIGDTVLVTYQTNLKFPSDGSVAGTANYQARFSASGYEIEVEDTLTSDAYVGTHYRFMHTFPSDMAGSTGLGGGFDDVTLQPSGKFTYGSTGQSPLSVTPDAIATWNSDYVAVGWPLNASDVEAAFADLDTDDGGASAFIANNATNPTPASRNKLYIQAFSKKSGVLVSAGRTWTIKNFYGVAPVREFARLING